MIKRDLHIFQIVVILIVAVMTSLGNAGGHLRKGLGDYESIAF